VQAKAVRNGLSADLLIRYDAERYTLNAIRTTPETEGWLVAAMDRSGEVRIAMAGAEKLNGDMVLLELDFTTKTPGHQEETETTVNHESKKDTREAASANLTTKAPRHQEPENPTAKDTEDAEMEGSIAPLAVSQGVPSAAIPEPSAGVLTTKASSHPEPTTNNQELASVVWLVINENAPPGATPAAENAMGERNELPKQLYLAPPVPNPFGSGTILSYGLPVAGEVQLKVFDAAGRCVRTLAQGPQAAGRYSVTWNGRDDKGRQLANGVYFVGLRAGEQRLQRKATLLRN
jgi:hypothetical protein